MLLPANAKNFVKIAQGMQGVYIQKMGKIFGFGAHDHLHPY